MQTSEVAVTLLPARRAVGYKPRQGVQEPGVGARGVYDKTRLHGGHVTASSTFCLDGGPENLPATTDGPEVPSSWSANGKTRS